MIIKKYGRFIGPLCHFLITLLLLAYYNICMYFYVFCTLSFCKDSDKTVLKIDNR